MTLYEEYIKHSEERRKLNARVSRSFRLFSVGIGSGGGLYISKESSDGTKKDQINAIDYEAAKFIILSLTEIYGEEILNNTHINDLIVIGNNK